MRRARLERLLNDLTGLPVTLVVAPAGAGKTALAADWCSRSSLRHAWVTLDEPDADPRRLWTLVAAAIEVLRPGCWAELQPFLVAGEFEGAVSRLVTFLEEGDDDPVLLFVDNLHHLEQSDEAERTFARFLEDLSRGLHVVVLSRHRPRIAIDRMRGRATLAEIGFTELRFSAAESAGMLKARDGELSTKDIARAAGRADGWAVALQLLALASRADRATPARDDGDATADQLLDSYLRHEVLAREPAELVGVLVDACVVEQVTPALAEALTGRADAADLLAEAERRSMLVTRLAGGWFQMHGVLRSMLQDELRKPPDTRLVEQHVRAARWFEEGNDPVAAVRHWVDARQYSEALEQLATAMTRLYDLGDQAVTIRLMRRIPPSAARGDLRTMQNLALCQLSSSSDDFLETVAALPVIQEASSGVTPTLRGRTRVLQLMTEQMTGHWEDDRDLARRAIEDLGAGVLLDPIARFTWNEVARTVALTESWADDSPRVVRTKAELSIDPERRLALEGTRAFGLALSGRPVDALRVAAGVWRTAENIEDLNILRAEIALTEALASSELGDEPRGRLRLVELASVDSQPVTYVQVLAALALVEHLLRESDVEAAKLELMRSEALVRRVAPGPQGVSALARVGVLVALADGDLVSAQGWCSRVSDPFWGPVSRARMRIAQDNTRGAGEALATASPRCPRHEVVVELLRGVAAEDPGKSEKHVITAIERATDVGLLATVATEGYRVRELIERAAWRVPQEWLDRLRRLTRPPTASSTPVIDGPEQLTSRELEVLRLLASRLTLREIAGVLFVSQNTLKFHLRTVYRKLGVHGRAEALEAARAQGLNR